MMIAFGWMPDIVAAEATEARLFCVFTSCESVGRLFIGIAQRLIEAG